MAKQIRNCYVHKKYNRWWRYLPRRNDSPALFDYEKHQAGPEHFEDPMNAEPPKLWLAWIYRNPEREHAKTRQRLQTLFGDDYKPGKLQVFRNTADVNEQLWWVKHLIDLKPVTFPNGEPTEADIPYLRVSPDGTVTLNKATSIDTTSLNNPKTDMTPRYLSQYFRKRDVSLKDVYPDTVYNPSNITVVD